MLVVPNQNRAALAQPPQRSFNNPAAGRMSPAAAAVQLLLADPTNMRRVSTTHRRRMTGGVVIPLVQTQVLLLARRRPGFRYHDGLQCALQQFRVMNIGPGDHDAQRTAVGVDYHASLHPVFASIRRVLAHVIPPKRALPMAASADCHRQSTPPSSSQARVNFLQIFSSTPLRAHRWKYR